MGLCSVVVVPIARADRRDISVVIKKKKTLSHTVFISSSPKTARYPILYDSDLEEKDEIICQWLLANEPID